MSMMGTYYFTLSISFIIALIELTPSLKNTYRKTICLKKLILKKKRRNFLLYTRDVFRSFYMFPQYVFDLNEQFVIMHSSE